MGGLVELGGDPGEWSGARQETMTRQLGAQHCPNTHLAEQGSQPQSTQITLIHFKPTLSPEALQQILLKPYLHNVVSELPDPRQGTPGVIQQLVNRALKLVNLSH